MFHAINDPAFNDTPLCEQTRSDQLILRRVRVQFPDVDVIECTDCRQRLNNRPAPTRNLLAEIQADMLRRNPRLADPEWATEDYRPLRNRR